MNTPEPNHKVQIINRLKRAEGQVRAIIHMVETEQDCEKIAQQLAAARKALDRTFYDMVACMTAQEFDGLGVNDQQAKQRMDKLMQMLKKYA